VRRFRRAVEEAEGKAQHVERAEDDAGDGERSEHERQVVAGHHV